MGVWSTVRSWWGGASAHPGGKDARGKGMHLADFLTEKTIVFFPSGPSKRQVIGHLISLLDLPDPNAALNAILAREEAGSTVVAPGLALPHARVPGVSRLQAAIGLCPDGVLDPKTDAGPVQVYVLFLGNADNMTQHLAFLARVSAVFQKAGFLHRLLRTGTPSRALELLRKSD